MKVIRLAAGVAAAACLCTTAAVAQTQDPTVQTPEVAPSHSEPESLQARPGMSTGVLGDWGGLRPELYDKGFDF